MAKENDEGNQQELIMKLGMFEQQMRQIQEQLQLVEHNTIELSSLSLGLDELKGKKDKEILAQVGRGIFVKAKLVSEDLIVDVGSKNFVNKNIADAKKLIENQIGRLNEIKESLNNSLEELNTEVTKIILNAQEDNRKKEKIAKA